jgi:hypothetical protein
MDRDAPRGQPEDRAHSEHYLPGTSCPTVVSPDRMSGLTVVRMTTLLITASNIMTKHPLPETTAGIFLEHYDLSFPDETGEAVIVYRQAHRAARDAAREAGWMFRSYSDVEMPGTGDDFARRNIRSFPTLILFRDGMPLGRRISPGLDMKEDVLEWARVLLDGSTAADAQT